MKQVKALVLRHFELVVVLVLVLATAFAVLFAANKMAFLNFFYIPTLVAAYFLGRRQGVLVALVGVLMVGIYAVINPTIFEPGSSDLPQVSLALWGVFVVATAFVVGTLYEIKQSAVQDLRQAYQGILAILAKFIDAVDSYTQEYSMRVSDLAAEIAEHMDLPDDDVLRRQPVRPQGGNGVQGRHASQARLRLTPAARLRDHRKPPGSGTPETTE